METILLRVWADPSLQIESNTLLTLAGQSNGSGGSVGVTGGVCYNSGLCGVSGGEPGRETPPDGVCTDGKSQKERCSVLINHIIWGILVFVFSCVEDKQHNGLSVNDLNFCHQTQEVQKAMDEKKFEEAVRLRGRYSSVKCVVSVVLTEHWTTLWY